MTGQLSYWDCQHIREILSDPVLLKIWLMDGDKAEYVSVSVDGKITFGRTKYPLLNWFFKDTKTESFTDFAFKTANALAGQSKNRNDVVFKGIADVVLEKAIADNDYRYVVDALYDTFRYGWKGSHQSKFIDATIDAPELPAYEGRTKIKHHGLEKLGEVRLNSGELLETVVLKYNIRT